MARVITVAKAQASKHPRSCYRCRKQIQPGDAYHWAAFRLGRSSTRRNWCVDHYPKAGELTFSEYLGSLSDLEDGFTQEISGADAETVKDACQSAAESVRELGQEQEEKRGNMPDSLQDSDTGNLLQERADACETLADELEEAASNIETAIDEVSTAESEVEEAQKELEELPELGEEPDEEEADEWALWDERRTKREEAETKLREAQEEVESKQDELHGVVEAASDVDWGSAQV